MDLLIATTNAHKVRELRALLKGMYDLYSLADFPKYSPPPEDGKSFEEIAIAKATAAAKATQMLTIGEDSGLVVPALHGAPGIYSARFAKIGATDKENRQKLLKEMESLKGEARFAYFECAIALATPEKLIKCVKGTAEGSVLEEERGGHGFGYDPLFMKHDYNQTFAELSENVKNKISHRAKAFQKLLIALESIR
ncbi:MAG: RdgB/HAM1 family non-canonical purine NTP pyrophosphatase [Chlamydiales bacterium]|nr:RdgB/HAM1 family non-canonical purine NTP pyrophosphatase [Chlamydiales bacterium]